ncbi:MAG: T9SS type A sorting domain-containing protein [Flavisolibacter sp.]
MRKFFLLIIALPCAIGIHAQTLIQEQYASSVLSFSSEYNTTNYSANQILGVFDRYPACGGDKAWAPATVDGGPEYIEVAYATPQPVNTIKIYQTDGAGSVTSVLLREAGTSNWNTVYTATAAANGCSKILEITIPTTAYNVDAVHINIDNNVPNWQYLDAVSIANFSVMTYSWNQYVGSVLAFSSQYSTTSWNANQVKGAPDTYPNCGDIATAWAPATQDGGREFLVLGFTYPAKTNRIRIFETNEPGFVDTVYLRDASNGTWHQIYSATAASNTMCPYVLELNFTTTTYDVDAVRIAMDNNIPGWNEIDAVEMQSNLPANAKFTVQSGNWSNTATWAGGTLPTATDTVVVGNGHEVALDMNSAIKSMFIGNGGILDVNSGNTLTLGPSGGGSEYLQVQGALNIANGTLNVNGYVEFFTGSSFTMGSGQMMVDGNDGTLAGSARDGFPLVKFDPGMSVLYFTGGTILIVDPQYNATGQSIVGNYTFGPSSNVRFGNGGSTTASLNPNGFGGSNVFPIFGNFMLDAATTGSNRIFKNLSSVTVAGDLNISTGLLNAANPFIVSGNTGNNGTLTSTYGFKTNTLVNNSTINGAGQLTVVSDFTNTGTGVYNLSAYTSIGGSLVNNGDMTATWVYFANDFSTSSVTQTIGGVGTFNVFGLEFVNSSPGGVVLQRPLEVQQLYWIVGKFFLGNNDLTTTYTAYGNTGPGNYVVLNGTGKLINKNITTGSILFPIGTPTDYTPVTIINGSGHTFSAGVKESFTAAPPSPAVLREWNVTDVTGGAVSANITLQWNAADEDPSFTRNNCYVGHYDGSAWNSVSNGNPAAAGANPGTYQKTARNVSTFSPFSVFSGGTILPVHLLTFDAHKQGNGVKLSWKVDNESQLNSYDVERSGNGISFSRISTVKAVNAAAAHGYDVMDSKPLAGADYYRLRQLNSDGSYSFSKIVKVDFNHAFSVFLYPNPVRNLLTVQGMENFHTMQLIDAQGRILNEWKIINNTPLDLSRFQSGVYSLRLISKEETQTQLLIIAR